MVTASTQTETPNTVSPSDKNISPVEKNISPSATKSFAFTNKSFYKIREESESLYDSEEESQNSHEDSQSESSDLNESMNFSMQAKVLNTNESASNTKKESIANDINLISLIKEIGNQDKAEQIRKLLDKAKNLRKANSSLIDFKSKR
jgi:hypothetical protein